jgi:hypothetical protein
MGYLISWVISIICYETKGRCHDVGLVSKYLSHFAQDNEHYANIAPLFLLQMPLLFGPFCYPQLQQLQNQYAPLQACKSKFFSMIVL